MEEDPFALAPAGPEVLDDDPFELKPVLLLGEEVPRDAFSLVRSVPPTDDADNTDPHKRVLNKFMAQTVGELVARPDRVSGTQ